MGPEFTKECVSEEEVPLDLVDCRHQTLPAWCAEAAQYGRAGHSGVPSPVLWPGPRSLPQETEPMNVVPQWAAGI